MWHTLTRESGASCVGERRWIRQHQLAGAALIVRDAGIRALLGRQISLSWRFCRWQVQERGEGAKGWIAVSTTCTIAGRLWLCSSGTCPCLHTRSELCRQSGSMARLHRETMRVLARWLCCSARRTAHRYQVANVRYGRQISPRARASCLEGRAGS